MAKPNGINASEPIFLYAGDAAPFVPASQAVIQARVEASSAKPWITAATIKTHF